MFFETAAYLLQIDFLRPLEIPHSKSHILPRRRIGCSPEATDICKGKDIGPTSFRWRICCFYSQGNVPQAPTPPPSAVAIDSCFLGNFTSGYPPDSATRRLKFPAFQGVDCSTCHVAVRYYFFSVKRSLAQPDEAAKKLKGGERRLMPPP